MSKAKQLTLMAVEIRAACYGLTGNTDLIEGWMAKVIAEYLWRCGWRKTHHG